MAGLMEAAARQLKERGRDAAGLEQSVNAVKQAPVVILVSSAAFPPGEINGRYRLLTDTQSVGAPGLSRRIASRPPAQTVKRSSALAEIIRSRGLIELFSPAVQNGATLNSAGILRFA
jgi:hypothetical protein